MIPNQTVFSSLLWNGLLLSLAVNLLFYLFALIRRSDHFTDITYSLSFVILTLFYILSRPKPGPLPLISAVLVTAWAARLGGYLLLRIYWTGKDARFDRMRNKPLRFLVFWLLQAATVWLVLFPLFAFVSDSTASISTRIFLGLFLWAIGMTVETTADMQKFVFKARNPEGLWIDSGLWGLARHPNFFGEMLVWWGFFLVTLPSINSLRILALIGPLFITLMLCFVSGVPILEKSAQKRYGHLSAYRAYRTRTRLLIPLPRLRRSPAPPEKKEN